MNGCTVNIADYNSCRSMQGRISFSYSSNSNTSNAPRFGSGRDRSDLQVVSFETADLAQDGDVYDIGVAREAQRFQHRAAFRPISVPRRAKVLRFRSDAPLQMRIRTEERRAVEAWAGRSGGPYDLPPAA